MTRFAQTAAARLETPGVQMFSRRGRPLSKRARHQQELREHGELLDTLNLLVALFADDTTLITRRSRASDIENLAVQTLADWGQTVHPRKTERVVIQTAPPPQGCEHHLRFLGAWLEPDGRTGADTDHRLSKAKSLWRKVYAQLPRLGLSPSVQARLAQATVVASLLYGCETRPCSAREIRKYQTVLNTVSFGLLRQRRRTMQADKRTMSDLRKTLKMDTVFNMIGARALRFLGHIARKPDTAMEKQILFAWLLPEATKPAFKRGHQLRHHYWKLLTQLRVVLGEDVNIWSQKWIDVAQEDEGRTWYKAVTQWQKAQRDKDAED